MNDKCMSIPNLLVGKFTLLAFVVVEKDNCSTLDGPPNCQVKDASRQLLPAKLTLPTWKNGDS